MLFFFPTILLMFLLFLLLLPILFLMGYFHIVTLGFEKLGISPLATFLILFSILIGSSVNIPLTKKKLVYKIESRFFGLWQVPKVTAEGIAINLGGAIIPVLISFYFLFLALERGISFQPILISTGLMILISKFLAKIIPGRGITLPTLIPPIFSAIFALILAPNFAAPCAFISGVFGTLIGADILNFKKIQRIKSGFISIGGAGVFDGIFLVGIISALLS
jgi:uncharacterized membrane protein